MASNTLVLPLFALGLLAQHTPAQSAYPAAATRSFTESPGDSVNELKSALEQVHAIIRTQSQQLEGQRLQLEHQQFEIEQLRRQFTGGTPPNASAAEQEQVAASSAAMLNNELHVLRGETPVAASSQPLLRPAVLTVTSAQQATGAESGDKPLSVHFGNASLTPGGWVDFTGYYRSSDVGSGLGTSFASIPFKNTVLGGLSETRFSAQNSRIMLRADEKFGSTRVFGYAEADFNGYLPSNGYVSTNAVSLRLRVFFTDLQRGRWELLGGQSWSLLTPNRTGVSPFLSEIYNTLHLDTNY